MSELEETTARLAALPQETRDLVAWWLMLRAGQIRPSLIASEQTAALIRDVMHGCAADIAGPDDEESSTTDGANLVLAGLARRRGRPQLRVVKEGKRRPALDAGGDKHPDPTYGIPRKAYEKAKARIDLWRTAGGHASFPPTALYAGSNSDRQCAGRPGHCSVCAIIGHVEAHPEFGCGDVGCNHSHEPGFAGDGGEPYYLRDVPAGPGLDDLDEDAVHRQVVGGVACQVAAGRATPIGTRSSSDKGHTTCLACLGADL